MLASAVRMAGSSSMMRILDMVDSWPLAVDRNPSVKLPTVICQLRRQLDLKPRPPRIVVVHGNAAVVVVHDAVDDGQPQAGAAAFGRKGRQGKLPPVRAGDGAGGRGHPRGPALRGAAARGP